MLIVLSGSEISRQAALMERVYKFRHSVFVEEKGWTDLSHPDGLEHDQFDDAHAVHQICLRDDEIVGYQRLLPTTRPHLLTDVLNDLCRQRPGSARLRVDAVCGCSRASRNASARG
jgi:acyl-homoserine lactone synthase